MKYKMAFPEMMSQAAFSYLPFGASKPDRKIDYLFYGGPLELVDAEVLTNADQISDHLPLRVKFKMTDVDGLRQP